MILLWARGASAADVRLAALFGGFGRGGLLGGVVVVGGGDGVFVLQEDLGLVLAQPVVHAVWVADGEVFLAEGRLRGPQVEGAVVGGGLLEGRVFQQLVERKQVLFLVGGRHVAWRSGNTVLCLRRLRRPRREAPRNPKIQDLDAARRQQLNVRRLDVDDVEALILDVQVPQVYPKIIAGDERLAVAVY